MIFDEIDAVFRRATGADVRRILKQRPHLLFGVIAPWVAFLFLVAGIYAFSRHFSPESKFDGLIFFPIVFSASALNGAAVYVSISDYITACDSHISFKGDFRDFSMQYTTEQLNKGRLKIIYPPLTDRQTWGIFLIALVTLSVAFICTIILN